MTGKSFWLIFALAILAFFATIEAYPSNDLEGVNDEYLAKMKVREPKARSKKRRLENAVTADEKQSEALEILNAESENSWSHKHVRGQSRAKRLPQERSEPWDLIEDDEEMKDAVVERYVGRSKRNATAFKVPKRGHKKLKLALAQPSSKAQLGKTRSKSSSSVESFVAKTEKKVNRRHAAYSLRDVPERFRSKRYTVSNTRADDRADYYAQRRAVMERFYARQKEISEKYARKTTPSPPKYIHTYDTAENEKDKVEYTSRNESHLSKAAKEENAIVPTINHDNNNLDTTTRATSTTEAYEPPTKTTTLADQLNVTSRAYNSLEENNEEDASEDYDYYVLDENKLKSAGGDAGTLNEDNTEVFEVIKDPLKWGICDGRLVYQHNVIITVHNGARADADITTSLQGPFCVTCFRVTPAGKYNATESLIVGNRLDDDSLTSARIKVQSFQDQTLVYTVKVWALPKPASMSCPSASIV